MKKEMGKCGTIKSGIKLGRGRPEQRDNRCQGYREPDGKIMFVCSRCPFCGHDEMHIEN